VQSRARISIQNADIICINVSGAWKVPPKIILDGIEHPDAVLKLLDDRQEHFVEVKFQP
jgi:hypothetical protein